MSGTSFDSDLSDFKYRLPPHRLGTAHDTLKSFKDAVRHHEVKRTKEYTLVMVTEPSRRRILLGHKHRGFGKGFFNSFGGKVEPDETDLEGAVRELHEETGIRATKDHLQDAKVGVMRYTFDDSDKMMLVHLYRLDIQLVSPAQELDGTDNPSHYNGDALFRVHPEDIRGCDEITPQWFDNWYDIPFQQMHADDTEWLAVLLRNETKKLAIDGWFHFKEGGQDVNTVLHYCMDIRSDRNSSSLPSVSALSRSASAPGATVNGAANGTTQSKLSSQQKQSLEQKLFHELHSGDNGLSIKEFKECMAFANTVKSFFGRHRFDVVVDVAGGHGALAALMLVLTSASTAVVIDPANVGNGGVKRAWGHFFKGKTLRYRHEPLRSGLPTELESLVGSCNEDGRKQTERPHVLVLACHACQHLSEETVSIAYQYQTSVAVMPCCQKDNSRGYAWKSASKNMGVPVGVVMDILLAGKAMSFNAYGEGTTTEATTANNGAYDVRIKTIDKTVTPQNRIILCRAPRDCTDKERRLQEHDFQTNLNKAQSRMGAAYKKAHQKSAHGQGDNDGVNDDEKHQARHNHRFLLGIMLGVGVGILLSRSWNR